MNLGADSWTEHARATGPGELSDHAPVRDFVRSPFSVRRNVVKVWRTIPRRIWFTLNSPADRELSVRRERAAMIGVAILVLLLVAGFGSIGYRARIGDVERTFPLIGKSVVVDPTDPGGVPVLKTLGGAWYYSPGESLVLVLWVVCPSLAGWTLVRWLWIPCVVRRRAYRDSALTFARHLLTVYMFVYLMVAVGCALMAALIFISPTGTESFRWYLWCFLFGESFFVPAVMWGRLVIADRDGSVFGSHRLGWLGLYAAVFVVLPILGMVRQLD